MPLTINLRFLFDFGLPNMLATELSPEIFEEFLKDSGAQDVLPMSESRAITLVESGASFRCDASVGSDQSDGEGLKKLDGDVLLIEPKWILRVTLGASVEVLVWDVAEDRVIVDERLGRGNATSLSTTDPGEKCPTTLGRLSFQAGCLGGVHGGSPDAESGLRGRGKRVERLDPRLCECWRSPITRGTKPGFGESGRSASSGDEAEVRRALSVRWRLRSVDGE